MVVESKKSQVVVPDLIFNGGSPPKSNKSSKGKTVKTRSKVDLPQSFDFEEMEPLLNEDGSLGIIKISRLNRCCTYVPFSEMIDEFGPDVAKYYENYIIRHVNDWAFFSDFHPNQCLGSIEGREQFYQTGGDYVGRIRNVSERILQYLTNHIYLAGSNDPALVTGFIISTYFMPMFEYAPRLLIRGATNSGKSTLLNILRELCYHGNLAGDTTEASLFRMIDSCGITPLLDEFQDYDPTTRNGIKKVLKNGNVRGHTVQRTEKVGNDSAEPRSYNIFGPLAFINQAGGKSIPVEVVNRSIQIFMIPKMGRRIPMIPDRVELKEIRDELYTIRCLWLSNEEMVGFGAIFKDTISKLEDSEGIVHGSTRYMFTDRCRDILGTMYTVARMIGQESPILDAFDDMQQDHIRGDNDSDVGMVFRAMLDLLDDRMAEGGLYNELYTALQSLTTYDIARKYECMMSSEGELGSFDKVPTRHVANIVKDMGFSFDRDRCTNRSMISGRRLEETFLVNLNRYGTEFDLQKYHKVGFAPNSSKQERNVVRPMCQTSEIPNNLTRTEGA